MGFVIVDLWTLVVFSVFDLGISKAEPRQWHRISRRIWTQNPDPKVFDYLSSTNNYLLMDNEIPGWRNSGGGVRWEGWNSMYWYALNGSRLDVISEHINLTTWLCSFFPPVDRPTLIFHLVACWLGIDVAWKMMPRTAWGLRISYETNPLDYNSLKKNIEFFLVMLFDLREWKLQVV